MKGKYLLLPLILLLIVSQEKISAYQDDPIRVRTFACEFLQRKISSDFKSESRKGVPTINLIPVYSSSDTCTNKIYGFDVETGGYVFGLEHEGEVIITAYSFSGNISDAMNPEMDAFIKAYESSEIIKKQSAGLTINTKGALAPLLDQQGIAWDQGQYYNKFCPYDSEAGERTVTGCVATALGQIMRYHKFPSQGAGSHSYVLPKYGTLSADFGNTVYDWNSMPASLTSDNDDVARILFHIGVALNMNYGVGGSSASSSAIPQALSDYFRYYDAHLFDRDYFSYYTSEMQEVFRNELEKGRPIYYELMGDPPHAVVIDGYDGDHFHVNFGWGGMSNGYFLLSGTNFAGSYTFGFRCNSILGISPSRIPVSQQDSLALVSLYSSAGGTSWHNRSNWLTGRLKTWHGVDVADGRVIHLMLSDNNLAGKLPADIGKLTGLKGLNVSSNKLTGELPEEMGLLTGLYDLTISFNEFSGSIPAKVGNMVNLRTLQAGFNKFTGAIPAEIGQLSRLSLLSLAGNQLSGAIPDQICSITSLTSLDLTKNQLTGNLPASIGNLTLLTGLSIAENRLSGELPSSISALTQLTVFNIDNNSFTGALPSGIGSFNQLAFLNLDNNKFTSFPAQIGQLVNLQRFTAVNNSITGKLPSEIGQLVKLEHLDLSNNKITELPDEIGNLAKLEFLSLSGNMLSAIPSSIGKMKILNELRLTSNLLNGLPYEIGTMDNLVQLSADYNQITEVTFGLSLLRKLRILDLSYNRLAGSLPKLSHIPFHSFDIDHNNLNYNNIASSGFINPDPSYCFYRYQGVVHLDRGEIKYVVNDSVRYDVRSVYGLAHPSNLYSWYKDGVKKSDGPVLLLKNATVTDAGNYYCVVDNSLYPNLTLYTDTLKLVKVDSKESESSIVVSKPGRVMNIADKEVKILKPAGLRGEFQWQASLDSVNWVSLPLATSNPLISGNIKTVNSDSLVLIPVKAAVYRYRIREENCDPVYSDTVLISPFKSVMLLDTTLNVSSQAAYISLPEIMITIPKGISQQDFRLTVQKLETPPDAPDTVKLGQVFDVKMSCGTKFSMPLVIALKIKKDFNILKKDRYVAVYHQEDSYEWIPFNSYNISTTDTTMVFETDHLTKLTYWEKSWTDGDYTDKFTKDGVTVYYKAKHADLMGLYDKNQVTRPWHVPNGDPEYGTPLQVQDMAHYASEVMTRFRGLLLQVPDGITIYADDIDDYGVVGLLGMTNGYLTISIYIDDPDLLRSVIAHEYMHYTQDYYILAQPGNIFWMEANGHTADRMVWDDQVLPVSESDKYLLDKRSGENTIFEFLSKSWDHWDASILTQNLAGNVDFCYLAGTFIHYLRSYKDEPRLLPEVLLKETSYTGTWRDYLDNYIRTKLNSTINDQYEDYVKFIVSGKKSSFTLMNNAQGENGDPFKYFNQASEQFAEKHLIKLPEDEITIPVSKETIAKELEPLSARMDQFYNLSLNRSLCIKYVRQHQDTAGLHVYLCRYKPDTKTMEMTNISRIDSSYFFVLAASEPNISAKANQVFLLYINKSGNRSITADYKLEISPVTDFDHLFTFWFDYPGVTEAYIHQYNDGVKRRIYFWEQDGATRNKVYTDSSFTITETRSRGTLTLYYNFRNGDMTITETVSGTYGYFEDPDTHTAAYSGTTSVSLKNIFFAPQDEQLVQQGAGIYDFHSTGTSHTQGLINSISNTYHAECTDCGSTLVLESYVYTGTDWSSSEGIKLHIQVK